METRTMTPQRRWSAWQAGFGAMTLAAAALLGCATTMAGSEGKTHIDDSRLAGLSSDQMAPVTQQQQALTTSQNDLDAAKQAKEEADNRIKLAQTEHDVAKAQLSQAKEEADLTKKNLDQLVGVGANPNQPQSMSSAHDIHMQQQRLTIANEDVAKAQLRLLAADAKIEYLKSLGDVARATLAYDEKAIGLERAKLEQAKFQTLDRTNPAEVKAMGLQQADYDALIARQEAEVANANADVSRARADAASRYQVWVAADEKSGHRPLTPSEAASVPPPPKG